MHLRHIMFCKEILEKDFNVKDFWSRYEWQPRGSPHVHGFLWLHGAPNMDKLDWHNEEQVREVESFFHHIVHPWNPRACDTEKHMQVILQ